jgi:hypothetical protein
MIIILHRIVSVVCVLTLDYQQHMSSQSQSYITTDSQLASLSWCQAPIWDLRRIFLLSLINFWTVTGLFMWGSLSLSDERLGLQFSAVAGPHQQSLSQVRVPQDS